MLTFNTVFTSLVALHAFLSSTGQGQVQANVLRRASAGHSGRQSHVIRGLLNIPGQDESIQRRQSGCDVGFFACSDGTGCCPNGQTCDNLPDGTPTCCCTSGGNCKAGFLPCSANTAVCCPNGDLCSSDGTCSPAGSGGGGGGTGGGTGGGGTGGGTGGGGTGGGTGGGGTGGGGTGGGTGGGGTGGSGGLGGSTGGLGTTTSLPKGPGTTVTALPSTTPALGGLGGTTSPFTVVTVTPTPSTGSSGSGLKSGAEGLRAGTAAFMMGSVIVASGLALLIL